jgi:putative aldouronate transport system permease protein
MKKKRTNNNSIVSSIIIYAVIIIATLTCILPFIQVFSISVSSNSAVISNKVLLLPVEFNLDAYKSVFSDSSMIHSMLFTILLTIVFTALGMFLTICAAYPLTKENLMGHKAISVIFLITMFFDAGTIPNYLLINGLHMINTFWSLVFPMAFSAFNVILLKVFIQNTIPASLEEAARLDGCSNIGILLRIVLPLSAPILATLTLFFAVGRWNTFQDALYYISDQNLYPLQLKLNMLISASQDNSAIAQQESGATTMTTPQVLQAACVMFTTIPIVIVYPFLQKYFVSGVMIGSVKG